MKTRTQALRRASRNRGECGMLSFFYPWRALPAGATSGKNRHPESHSTQTGGMNIRCGELAVNEAPVRFEMGTVRGERLKTGGKTSKPAPAANRAKSAAPKYEIQVCTTGPLSCVGHPPLSVFSDVKYIYFHNATRMRQGARIDEYQIRRSDNTYRGYGLRDG